MTYQEEQREWEEALNTKDGQAVLLGGWKPLPATPIAPQLDPALLPPVLRGMAEAVAANLNIEVDLPALIGLGVASACACGRVSVRLKPDWIEPAQLFLLGIVDSGEGKTPAFKKMAGQLFKTQAEENKRLLRFIEADKAELEVLQAQKKAAVGKKEIEKARCIAEKITEFQSKMARPVNRFIGGDVTPERLAEIMRDNDGATSQMDDEGELFELLAGRYQDLPNLDPWLKGYSGGVPLAMERKGGSIIVDEPNLSVLILAQHLVIDELLDEKRMAGKGLIARFLIACPEPKREYAEEPDILAAVSLGYEETVKRLLALKKATLTLTSEAMEIFLAFRREIHERQWLDWEPLKRYAFIGKLAGNTARLACVLKLWEDGDTEEPIDALQMRNAVALARYFIDHMLHLLGGESELVPIAKEALLEIREEKQPLLHERELKKKLTKRKTFPTAEVVDKALDILANAGYIRRYKEATDGRSAAVIEVNPELLGMREEIL